MWKAQASQNEKISHKRWLKNEKWLSDYEENFIQSYMSSNPFFKVKRREQATNAESTAQPRKKSPSYAEVTRRPKTKTHFNRQSTTTSDQPNLEAIQTLLQQVQSQLNFQLAPRQQPKLKKTDRQTKRPKTFLYEPIVVHSDNDGDFLDDGASTGTLT